MNKLLMLKAKLAMALDAAAKIRDVVKAETRDFKADELKAFEAHMESCETVKAEIKQMEQTDSLSDKLDAELKSINEIPKAKTVQASTTVISGVKDNFIEDPKKGFKSHRQYLRCVLQAGMGASVPKNLEFMRASNHYKNTIQAVVGSDEHSTFADPFGGFLIPEAFSPDFLSLSPEADPIGGRTMKVPMEAPTVRIPARADKDHRTSVSGGLIVSRRAEADTTAATRKKYEQVVLQANGLFGISFATEELLTDSPISFIAILEQSFNDEFTSRLIDERLNGTGVGEFLGINNSPALITVPKEGGQTLDTLNFKNVINMRAQVWKYENSIWLANHDTIPQLAALNDGTNHIFLPSAREDIPDMLFGRPIVFSEYLEKIGDAGDIICANWSQYLEGILTPMNSAESVHVRFVNHERTFKFWMRNDGRPWWNVALTPKKSDKKLSPFVRLAERA